MAERCGFQGERQVEEWPGWLYQCGLPKGHDGPHREVSPHDNQAPECSYWPNKDVTE